jgi:hypothetical protein
VAPTSTEVFAIDPEIAAALLVTIGDNPDRLRDEASEIIRCLKRNLAREIYDAIPTEDAALDLTSIGASDAISLSSSWPDARSLLSSASLRMI